ncbi:hypothetical protein JXC34_05480 [Candidatus Woesearchaeota archaeon]|nr:hypothetical protein [Candidatus Woesearchaeota archaeon]
MVVIRVDTAKDSRDDIKKAVSFLQQFLSEDVSVNRDVFSSPEPEPSSGSAFSLFGQDPQPSPDPDPSLQEEEDNDEDLDIKPMFY